MPEPGKRDTRYLTDDATLTYNSTRVSTIIEDISYNKFLDGFLQDVNDIITAWKSPGEFCELFCERSCAYMSPVSGSSPLIDVLPETAEEKPRQKSEQPADNWDSFWKELIVIAETLHGTEFQLDVDHPSVHREEEIVPPEPAHDQQVQLAPGEVFRTLPEIKSSVVEEVGYGECWLEIPFFGSLDDEKVKGEAARSHIKAAAGIEPVNPLSVISLKPGTVINSKYRIEKLLFRKKFQASYLAEDTSTGVTSILYEIFFSSEPQEIRDQRKERLVEFVNLLFDIRPSSLVTILDFFEEEDRYYVIMEKVKGSDLAGFVRRLSAPLSEEQVIKIGVQMCEALEFLYCRPRPYLLNSLEMQFFSIDNEYQVKLNYFDFKNFAYVAGLDGNQFQGESVFFREVTLLARILYRMLMGKTFESMLKSGEIENEMPSTLRYLLTMSSFREQNICGDIVCFKKRLIDSLPQPGSMDTRHNRRLTDGMLKKAADALLMKLKV